MIYLTKGVAVKDFDEAYKFIGQGKIFDIPVLPIVFIVIFIIQAIIWKRTVLGRSIFAVGGNAQCARVSGIKVDRIVILCFTLCGLLSGMAGYMLSGYLGTVNATFGEAYSLTCVAAAVIGGVSIAGGTGKMLGIAGGVLLMTTVSVGLQIAGIDGYVIDLVEGAMVFAAVVIDSIRVRTQMKS